MDYAHWIEDYLGPSFEKPLRIHYSTVKFTLPDYNEISPKRSVTNNSSELAYLVFAVMCMPIEGHQKKQKLGST